MLLLLLGDGDIPVMMSIMGDAFVMQEDIRLGYSEG